MANKIIFSGPNDVNKLKIYQGVPTIAALKNDIITNIFVNTITDPSFTTEIDDDGVKFTITIDTDTELNDVLQYFNEGRNALRIKVQEKSAAIIEAPRAISPRAPHQPTLVRPTSSSVSTFAPRSESAPLYQPLPSYSPVHPFLPPQPSFGGMSFALIPSTPSPWTFNSPSAFTKPYSISGSVDPILRPILNARFVKHMTIDDETSHMYPGVKFLKTWKFRNEGGLNWPNMVKCLFVSKLTGDSMGAPEELPIPFPEGVAIGTEVDISVPMISPEKSGEYTGFWKLADESGKKFGQRVRVRINVDEPPQKSVLLDNEQSVADKKKHLARLFPDSAHSAFKSFLELFFAGTDYNAETIKAISLDMILDGTFRKKSGKRYTMQKIIDIVSLAKSRKTETSPRSENHPWPTDSDSADSRELKCSSPIKKMERIDKPYIPASSVEVATLLNDEDNSEIKKARLGILFPELAPEDFKDFLIYFFKETIIQKGSLDEILDGTIKNESGNAFTMDEIVQKVSMTRTQGAQRYPWL